MNGSSDFLMGGISWIIWHGVNHGEFSMHDNDGVGNSQINFTIMNPHIRFT